MTAGCSKSEPPEAQVKPVVVDLAPVRCTEASPADRAEFKRKVPRPAPPVTKDDTRRWIDTLELAVERKNAAGLRVVDEWDACRKGTQP
jgi:hypothetical protein